MRTLISSILLALVLAVGNTDVNAQSAPTALVASGAAALAPAPTANFTVNSTPSGGATVVGDLPNADLHLHFGAASVTEKPAPATPAQSTPVAVNDAETCSVGWCPLIKTGSWLAAAGIIILEIGLGLALLSLIVGGAFYFLRRLRERRMDHERRLRLGTLRGRAQVAEFRRQRAVDANDDAGINLWGLRSIMRHNKYLAELERTSHPRDDGSRYDVPEPIAAAEAHDDEDAAGAA